MECCYWTKKGLIRYCQSNRIQVTYGLSFICTLDDPDIINPNMVEILVDVHETDSEINHPILAFMEKVINKIKGVKERC